MTYLEDLNELLVRDLAILVQVEMVIHAAKFLTSQENAQFGHKLLEFELIKGSTLIFVKLLITKKRSTIVI